MSWNSVMGVVSSFALFLPVFIILVLRLGTYRTFPALLIYYGSLFIFNLLNERYIKADPVMVRNWGLANNLLDAPLVLTFLTYFSPSPAFTRRTRILVLGFIVFEGAVIAWRGFNVPAITIILGPGILTIVGFSLLFFVRHTKITVANSRAKGKVLITASLLFAYGCYGIIYLMYYVFKTPERAETFFIYFLVVTLSSMLISAGIFIEQKRIRRLQELKVTRRELLDIYAQEKKAAPSRRADPLDFDRELWN